MSIKDVLMLNRHAATVSLDILAFAQDYKMYGENSYVFNHKEYLHALYDCLETSMNDMKLNGEALEYHIKENKKIGAIFAAIDDIEQKELLETLNTMTELANNSAAITAIINSSTALTALINSYTAMKAVADSSIAMTIIVNDSTISTELLNSAIAMKAVVDSVTAMKILVGKGNLLQKMANNDDIIQILAGSSLRKTLLTGRKVNPGLLLAMSVAKRSFFSPKNGDPNRACIEYTDGTFYPTSDSASPVSNKTVFGSLFKQYPKAVKYIRATNVVGTDDENIEIILIEGKIELRTS